MIKEDVLNKKSWFLVNDGERQGPFSENEMLSFIQNGSLNADTSIWTEGFSDWKTIRDSSLSKYLIDQGPPPLTGDKVDNNLVWFLAFAPLLGYLLEYFIGGMLWGETVSDAYIEDKLWFITLGLNLALSFADEKKLQKAGHETEKLKGWTWLVPVYLYQRANILKQSHSYFVVWCICFGLILLS